MKPARFFISAAAVAVITAAAISPTRADPGSTTAGGAPASAPTADVSAIRQAPNPSTAIAAYAAGQVNHPGNLDIEREYVRRMVDFGLPEMADTQAQDLVARDAQNGLGWAVAGYMSANRGQTAQAITDLAMAAKWSSEDAFVQRTAGQVLAWYDTRGDKTQSAADGQTTAEALRTELAGKPGFAATYSAAVQADTRLAGTLATQPGAPVAVATSEPTTSAAADTPDFQPVAGAPYAPLDNPGYVVPTSNGYSPYSPYNTGYVPSTNPYTVSPPCGSCCPTPCLTGPVCWPVPTGPTFIGNGLGYHADLFHHEPEARRTAPPRPPLGPTFVAPSYAAPLQHFSGPTVYVPHVQAPPVVHYAAPEAHFAASPHAAPFGGHGGRR